MLFIYSELKRRLKAEKKAQEKAEKEANKGATQADQAAKPKKVKEIITLFLLWKYDMYKV